MHGKIEKARKNLCKTSKKCQFMQQGEKGKKGYYTNKQLKMKKKNPCKQMRYLKEF